MVSPITNSYGLPQLMAFIWRRGIIRLSLVIPPLYTSMAMAVILVEGFGVIGLDYRGYGRSEGSPSEQGFYMDARAAIDYASKELSVKPEQMIAYGESIGTGVAVQMATEYPFQGLVLQSPFTSVLQLGKDSYPWLPVEILQLDRFDSLSKIGNIHSPLLVIHGAIDLIVPIKYGKQLFVAAPEPKEFSTHEYSNHLNLKIGVMAKNVLEFAQKHGMIKQ